MKQWLRVVGADHWYSRMTMNKNVLWLALIMAVATLLRLFPFTDFSMGTIRFEGISWGGVKVGAQLTPPRKFMMHGIDRWIPLESSTFSPMESLAYGGLGNGWGLGCFVFSGPELEKAGLDHGKMKTAYEVISRRHA